MSIGIGLYPDSELEEEIAQSSATSILQNADTAMYHAKLNGRNNFKFFQSVLNVHAKRRSLQKKGLRRALKANEFLIHYQPQVHLVSGAIVGAEALLRWNDPAAGMTYPEEFISTAERCGLIVSIGKWVLREVCRQMRAWLDAGIAVVPVSINVSVEELCRQDFSIHVQMCLQEFGLAPSYLHLELTESVMMRDVTASAFVLGSLREAGVHIALDDFGKGYSSLSYLTRLPISILKIDRSFIEAIEDSENGENGENGRLILGAIISLGKNLQQRVVAEGVTTALQLEVLLALNCEVGQGALFSQPLAAEVFAALLGRT